MLKAKELKQKLKISSIFLGENIDLEQVGKDDYKCCCPNPLHNDKQPSCGVNDRKGIFKCFSCGAGGDIFNFIKLLYPQMSFFQQLNYVNNKYNNKEKFGMNNISFLSGQNIHTEDIEINIQDSKDFRKIMNYIALYCSEKLSDKVRDKYLIKTNKISYSLFKGEIVTMYGYGLCKELIKDYKIGFMPNKKKLYNELLTKFPEELIKKTQLFDSRGMPKFRNRIVIPYIKDRDVVYFTARQTEFTPKTPYDSMKYVNQQIDNKYLYNQDDIQNLTVFITEGAFDALAIKNLHYKNPRLNYYNTISIGGVQGQTMLQKYYQQLQECALVYVCFDNDGGSVGVGNKASVLLNDMLQKNNIFSHQVFLPLYGKKKVDVNEYLGYNKKEDFNCLLDFNL